MTIQSLNLCLTFIVLAGSNLSAQMEWTADRSRFSSTISYFDSVDTIYYEPVHGANGKTYLNAEEAVSDGATNWKRSGALGYEKVTVEQAEITWIEFLEINGMQAEDMSPEDGYQDQSNYIFDLFAAGSNYLFLNAKKMQETCEMNWKIWIDFNENHEFEAAELVHVGIGLQQEIRLQLPNFQPRELITRMRIAWAPQAASFKARSLVMGSVKDVSVYLQ